MYFVRRMDHMQGGAVNKIIGRILVPRMERHIPILCPMGPREEGGERSTQITVDNSFSV